MNENEYKDLLDYLKGEINTIWEGKKIEKLEKQSEKFIVKNDKIYKKTKEEELVKVLKEHEKESILYMVHDHPTGGHFGRDATYNKIAGKYYWKGMKKDIEEYVKTCDKCQRRGQKGGEGYLNPIKVGKAFEMIGIDFVGPLNRTRKGNKYILVITDYLTKWPEAKAMREATAEKVTEYLYKEIICRHGCPKVILSDRGSHFNNKMMEELCQRFEIKHRKSAPYHPQTNGLVERFNRTLCESLAKVSEEENQWDEHIEEVLFAYRTNKHSTTKQTPFYLTYGREAILPIDEIEESLEVENIELSTLKRIYEIVNLEEKREETLEVIGESQDKQKERYDKKVKEVRFLIGDQVLLKDAAKEKQWSGKLTPKWKGPYEVHEEIGKNAYKIKNEDGRILKAPTNVKQLKKYYPRI